MTTIFVTFQQEGWHRWEEAPLNRAYLKVPHRHVFHFRLEVKVQHANREIELHNLREWALTAVNMQYGRSCYSTHGLDFETQSCEEIAEWLTKAAIDHYDVRWAACEVSEDGECGARVEVRE